ncbi:MAG: trigger factor [Anaerolineales bacterium]|nr:trigger factor [Anaerolineales bacterium]
MKIETTPREDHQVTLTVEIEQDKWEGAKKRAARQLAKRGKIAGFRPGKAPYDVIRRQYGDEAILESAIDILLDEVYPQALAESELKPSGPGALEKMDSLEPPVFTFTVPLKPEIDLGDYRKIRLPFKWKKPNEKEVDAKLEELRKLYATTVPVERPIEEGDYVLVDVVGTQVGAEEGQAPVFEKTGHAVFIAPEKREGELPFVGFGSKLIGMSAGESKTISKKFPKSYEDEDLRGRTVKYKLTVKTVHGTEFPELDDEFAKSVGAGETLEELRELLTKNLEEESRAEYEDEYYTQLIDKIKEGATIKYPPQVVEHETEHVVADIKQRLAQQGMEFETYLKMQDTTLEKFTEEEARPVAVKRLERGLIFDELARAEKIEVAEEELQGEFGQTLMELQQQGYDLSNVKGGKRAQREIAENIAFQSANRVMTRRTLERIKAIATGELEKEEKAAKAAKKEEAAAKKADADEKSAEQEAAPKKKTAAKKKPAEKAEEK